MRVNHFDVAAWVAGIIGVLAAIASVWLGQHMLIWSGFAAVALIVFAALAEKEGHR